MSNKLCRTAKVAHLPEGTTDIFIVRTEYRPTVSVQRFSDMKNLKTDGEYFSLYWPKDDHKTRYHCTHCFLSERDAKAEARRYLDAAEKSARDSAALNRAELG